MNRILAAALALLVLAASDALACSCAGPSAPDRAYADATVVFEGKVLSIDDQYTALRKAWDDVSMRLGRDPDWQEFERTHGFKVTFEVTKAWKGALKKRFVLYTGRGGGDCGFPFEKGKEYVVYAYCGKKYCDTMICTRTKLKAGAAEDLRYFATRKK